MIEREQMVLLVRIQWSNFAKCYCRLGEAYPEDLQPLLACNKMSVLNIFSSLVDVCRDCAPERVGLVSGVPTSLIISYSWFSRPYLEPFSQTSAIHIHLIR